MKDKVKSQADSSSGYTTSLLNWFKSNLPYLEQQMLLPPPLHVCPRLSGHPPHTPRPNAQTPAHPSPPPPSNHSLYFLGLSNNETVDFSVSISHGNYWCNSKQIVLEGGLQNESFNSLLSTSATTSAYSGRNGVLKHLGHDCAKGKFDKESKDVLYLSWYDYPHGSILPMRRLQILELKGGKLEGLWQSPAQILEGKAYHLQLGWFGVVNRSQADINKKVDMIAARQKEQEFFANSPNYRHLADRMGSEYLAKMLSKHLESVIKQRIPGILSLIDKFIAELEAELTSLGKRIAADAGVASIRLKTGNSACIFPTHYENGIVYFKEVVIEN
eukprot:Gb_17326 [translate_table: standard]